MGNRDHNMSSEVSLFRQVFHRGDCDSKVLAFVLRCNTALDTFVWSRLGSGSRKDSLGELL